MKLNIETKILMAAVGITLGILFFIYFGLSSVKMLFGFMLVSVAFFMLLRNFDLDLIEKLIFSAIFSVGIYSTYTYWLSLLFSSIKTGMLISLAIIIGMALIFHFYLSNNPRKQLYIILILVITGFILWLLADLFVINNIQIPSYVQQFYDCIKNGTDTLTCGQRF